MFFVEPLMPIKNIYFKTSVDCIHFFFFFYGVKEKYFLSYTTINLIIKLYND